jgi:2'-5' RNA ligase
MPRNIEAYSYGCLMAMLPDEVATRIRGFAALIPDEDIFEDGSGEHGRETQPHITVKYGLHTDDGALVASKMSEQVVAHATLGSITAFENEKFTVLKLDIDSRCLHRLNAFVSENFEVTDKYPEYHPHATIAYLRKGADWKKYACDLFKGTEVTFDTLLFSCANDVETVVALKGTKALAARVANRVANEWIERMNIADQYPDHKTEMQVKIQIAYEGDEHTAQQDFMDKLIGLGVRKAEIVMGATAPNDMGIN